MAKSGLWVVQLSPDEWDFMRNGWEKVIYRSVSEFEARREYEARKKLLKVGNAIRLARDGHVQDVAYGPVVYK